MTNMQLRCALHDFRTRHPEPIGTEADFAFWRVIAWIIQCGENDPPRENCRHCNGTGTVVETSHLFDPDDRSCLCRFGTYDP